MSISSLKTALKTTLTGVTGLKTIYTTAPAALANADLPALVIFAGAAQYKRQGFTTAQAESERVYLLNLYVKPIIAGKYGEAETALEPFFARIATALGATPRLGSADVLDAVLTGDDGPAVMNYGNVDYLGATFRVKVENV